MKTFLTCLRILALGFLAYVSAGLTIMWLGTGEWAVLLACVTVWSVMGLALKREVPRADPRS